MFKDERGTTMIEALMAITVLVIGVIGTFTTFDGIRQLGMLGEKKQSATRYAQSEIESMRNLGWANLKLNATPPAASDTRGTVGGRQHTPRAWRHSAQALVVASAPASCTSTTCVNPGPESWTYGSASGSIYRYVTKSQRLQHHVCVAALHRPASHHGRRHRQRVRTLRSRRSSAPRSSSIRPPRRPTRPRTRTPSRRPAAPRSAPRPVRRTTSPTPPPAAPMRLPRRTMRRATRSGRPAYPTSCVRPCR